MRINSFDDSCGVDSNTKRESSPCPMPPPPPPHTHTIVLFSHRNCRINVLTGIPLFIYLHKCIHVQKTTTVKWQQHEENFIRKFSKCTRLCTWNSSQTATLTITHTHTHTQRPKNKRSTVPISGTDWPPTSYQLPSHCSTLEPSSCFHHCGPFIRVLPRQLTCTLPSQAAASPCCCVNPKQTVHDLSGGGFFLAARIWGEGLQIPHLCFPPPPPK